ncbi:Uncharacterized protein dnm_015280 [Desulfonema magnum]|uniref:Uncharacterized protein n=1 Tax=Desulfonema magnum TaxID=45655 RepID=A0A975BHI3_9BACT|nr:Uncharacterized protein dnm_015280 [Desulfonema magnum]
MLSSAEPRVLRRTFSRSKNLLYKKLQKQSKTQKEKIFDLLTLTNSFLRTRLLRKNKTTDFRTLPKNLINSGIMRTGCKTF